MSLLTKAGVRTFVGLDDTPAAYTGQAAKVARVNAGESAVEVVDDIAEIAFVIDGGGATISTGEAGHVPVTFDGEIVGVEMEAAQVGSIVVDIWKDTYGNFPPTVADTITAGAKPTIAGAQKYKDETLTGWTTTITAGDVLAYNVDSVTTIQRVTVTLKVRKT